MTGGDGKLTIKELPKPTRPGFDFDGWFVNYPLTDTGKVITIDFVYAAGLPSQLTARWTWVGESYTITFNANGGTVSPTSGVTGEEYKLASLPVPTRSGYTWLGWFTKPDGGSLVEAGDWAFHGNTEIYAHWEVRTTTGGIVHDERDGKDYKYVEIGGKMWMAENLNYDIPDVTTDRCYDDDDANCEIFGRMYDWTRTAGGVTSESDPSGVQGVCFPGWHVPSDAEWTALLTFVGENSRTKLSSPSSDFWNYREGSVIGTDDYGFSGVGGGWNDGAGFDDLRELGRWWSTSGTTRDRRVWVLSQNQNVLRMSQYLASTSRWASVRCVRD
jgi:uncharacterized protein (TIGR02145 family)/uncharacterized repeat protein (TIGR02543 family)